MLDEQHQRLSDDILAKYSVSLNPMGSNHNNNRYREDAKRCAFMPFAVELTDELKAEIYRFMDESGWQFAPYPVEHPDGTKGEHIWVARRKEVKLEVGYHATRRVKLPSIMKLGLLPGTADRQNTKDRLDCVGKSFICEKLGSIADVGVTNSCSSHWWRDHLSRVNEHNDPDWVILRLEVGKSEVRTYADIMSKSGIVMDRGYIPPELILLVWPEGT